MAVKTHYGYASRGNYTNKIHFIYQFSYPNRKPSAVYHQCETTMTHRYGLIGDEWFNSREEARKAFLNLDPNRTCLKCRKSLKQNVNPYQENYRRKIIEKEA